jgi:hypothetical protein
MLSNEEKETILKTYKWIKMKQYKDDESLSWEERYNRLNEHHIGETTFLINKVRELVSLLND